MIKKPTSSYPNICYDKRKIERVRKPLKQEKSPTPSKKLKRRYRTFGERSRYIGEFTTPLFDQAPRGAWKCAVPAKVNLKINSLEGFTFAGFK